MPSITSRDTVMRRNTITVSGHANYDIAPDGSVLFHPQTEVYFGLNETGTVIWTALMNGASSEEALVAAVVAQWPDAPSTDVYCHVRELLADLSVEGLVVDTVATLG